MKIGIVMTIHNRPELTRQSLESLKRSRLPNCYIVLVDDQSDQFTKDVIDDFTIIGTPVIKMRTLGNVGVKKALIVGVDECLRAGCDLVTNLDNDVKLKPNWLLKLLELHHKFPHRILTGFHSTTRNLDGSERHAILQQGEDWVTKKSVGGINMVFDERLWNIYIKDILAEPVGNWDHEVSKAVMADNEPIICITPSVIQHTGVTESSMGHNQEQPDVAADYYELELPDVTLFGLDTQNFQALQRAAMVSQLEIKFGAVRLLGSGVSSKEEYSRFIIERLHEQFTTSHVLVIQADGYVLNASAWKDEWLEYDYIGATWLYKDNSNVGNGGFSLRSKRLMELISIINPDIKHPEDHVICRNFRGMLEDRGMRFAPEEVANQFSVEAYGCEKLEGANKYSGQFGFHGWNVDFGSLPNAPVRPKRYDARLKRWV